MLDAMPPASRARRWRKVFGRQREKGRDASHIAPDTALGREASPGQESALTVRTDIFRPLHFVPTARKLPGLTDKTSWPETAENYHYRGKPMSRPC